MYESFRPMLACVQTSPLRSFLREGGRLYTGYANASEQRCPLDVHNFDGKIAISKRAVKACF